MWRNIELRFRLNIPRLAARTRLWNLEDEKAWLRARIIRLRRLLRYVKRYPGRSRIEGVIGDAEARLDILERNHLRPLEDEPTGG